MRRRTWIGAAAAAAAGCSMAPDVDYSGADAPRAVPLAHPPQVAWVFSSGGPRGFVHVGVVKALDELGLRPDLIVGASVGALVGCLRASGVPGVEIETLALELQPTQMARLAIWSDQRFSGAPVADLVHRYARQRLLEDMAVPMACVATRQRDHSVVAFTAGDAGVAVQASAAIEGQFTPVRIRGEPHVDADWFSPLPVRLTRTLGAKRVLAVDASVHIDRAPSGAERYREGDLRKRALVQPDAQQADLLLHPDFGYWVSFSREFRERAIGAGYRATMEQAARLRELHQVAPPAA